jgi:DNA-binding CsgD family transcriptional regulator
VSRGWRGASGRVPDGGAISGVELAVARLVATGLTNREVAGQLYVSVKTVEYQLGNRYIKPDITSRRALAELLCADALSVRLLNRARWEPNDLVDMLYLSCAAAYADGVAAERTAARYLDTAWSGRPDPCPVVPTLHQLVAHLTDLGLE